MRFHSILLRFMLRASRAFRRRRLARFLQAFEITAETRIVDVGGGSDWDWSGFTGVTPRITLLNLDVEDGESGRTRYVRGDACRMHQFADDEFDIAFSNSVIEHVGSYAEQQAMAGEIRRVARAYWVQTPNRHFPIEPHMLFPFFQYLPLRWRRTIGRHWPFSFEKLRKGDPERDAVEVRLLNRREFSACFPDAEIRMERFAGWIKSFIAYKPL